VDKEIEMELILIGEGEKGDEVEKEDGDKETEKVGEE
jgi:hypothetical protein